MDNIQIILYIVFVAIAILSRLLKAKKPKHNQPSQESTDTSEPVSFEDLLKEFTGETKKAEPATETFERNSEYVDYQRKEEHYDDERAAETFRAATQNADKFKKLEERVKLNTDRPIFGHFDEYDNEEETTSSELVSMLKDEEGIRKAVILSEILNRKY